MARSEFDLRRYDWSRSQRGKYLARAKRSLAVIAIEREILDALGGPEAACAILRTLASSLPKKARRRAA